MQRSFSSSEPIHLTNENSDCAIVSIVLHNYCNFSCSYCTPTNYGGTHKWPSETKSYLDFLGRIRQRNKYLIVDLLGGEPTLWPQFQSLVNEICDDNTHVDFSTNASRPLQYWRDFKGGNFTISMSWHHEQCDDEHFLNVAKIFQDKATVNVLLLVVPENFERAKRMMDRLDGLSIDASPKFVTKTIGLDEYMDYTPEQKEWIQTAGFVNARRATRSWKLSNDIFFNKKNMRWTRMLTEGTNNFEGWRCSAGIRRFYVTVAGDIFRCVKHVGGSLGNVFGSYSLPDDPIICNQRACGCKSDAMVEKWSPNFVFDIRAQESQPLDLASRG